jgi:hypothetical protein
MKFDEVYDFYLRGPHNKASKLELALFYLSEMHRSCYHKLELAEIQGLRNAALDQIKEDNPIPLADIKCSETIDFTREDILEYLCSEGSKIDPY